MTTAVARPHARTLAAYATALVLSYACAARDARDAKPLTDVVQTGRLSNVAISEASGIVASPTQSGVLWTFNDSGNDEELFALDSAGTARGRVAVSGAKNRDWEAMAAGPCDEGACLYIGDVGDNGARRRRVTLYRVREPQVADSVVAVASALEFSYPDGPHDVEALWVSPDTTVWLATKRPLRASGKRFRPALLFRLPAAVWRSRDAAVAELVDSLPIVPDKDSEHNWITDASFVVSAGQGRVAIRMYQGVIVMTADTLTGRPLAEHARCSLRPLGERSGEAVAWLGGERLIFANEGRRSRLATGRCQP